MARMFASTSFQNVTKVSAHSHHELESAPLIIAFTPNDSDDWSRGEVIAHLHDPVLAKALAEAINRVVAEHEAAQTTQAAA